MTFQKIQYMNSVYVEKGVVLICDICVCHIPRMSHMCMSHTPYVTYVYVTYEKPFIVSYGIFFKRPLKSRSFAIIPAEIYCFPKTLLIETAFHPQIAKNDENGSSTDPLAIFI